jgi:F1F0 ATPase subunit 2
MNSTTLLWCIAFLGGLLTGVTNYAGLWFTVRKLHLYSRPLLAVMLSMLVRTIFCLVVMYLVTKDHPERLIACLAGFFLIRLLSVRYMGEER